MRLLVMVMLLAACLAAPAAADDAPAESQAHTEAADGGAILQEFFKTDDEDRRAELARRFGEVRPEGWGEVRRLLHRSAPYPELEPGRQRIEAPAEDGHPAVSVLLRVPENYDRDSAEGWPLVIGCHGLGGSAEGQMALLERVLGPVADEVVLACPEAPKKGVFRAQPIHVDYPIRVLRDLRMRVNVNNDRVVLTGYSKGGYTAWAAGMFWPDTWAAVVPMAAFPLTEARIRGLTLYLDNLRWLAVQAHWGENDIVEGQTQGINTFCRQAAEYLDGRSDHFEAIEYEEQGHSLELDREAVRRVVRDARREAVPKQFEKLFHRTAWGRAWVVRAVEPTIEEFDFTRTPVVRADRPEDVQRELLRMYRRQGYYFSGRIAADRNRVLLNARNLRRIEVMLPAAAFDWDRPVRVSVNGRLAEVVRDGPDWVELLETARRMRDFERLVGKRIEIRVPGVR